MPMQSRTDQVHSYEFFLQRVVSGLVARESDPAELPFRRLGWSGFGSVMVAIVVAAVFGIIGVLRGGGNTSWQEENSIIEEKGSNQVYLYVDDKLHPMANMVSAQLATGGGEVVRVSARSLEGVPRGATLGIPGLPHRFPDGDNLRSDAWTLCSQEQTNEQGETETISVLGVGKPPEGGQPAGDRAVLVQEATEGGRHHMVLGGYRYEVDPQVNDAVLQALRVSSTDSVPVSPAFVDALPEGDRLELPANYQPGEASSAVPGEELLTGQVIQDDDRYYLVRVDELDEITQLQAEIIRRFSGEEPVPETLSASVDPNALRETETSPPRAAPQFVSGTALGRSACAAFPSGAFTPTVLTGGRLNPLNATQLVSDEQSSLASYVDVPGGAAVLVQSVSAPDAAGGAWYVVNDQGTRFALRDANVIGMPGYATDQGVRMSGGLVGLLPAGPDLDPAAAGPAPAGAS
jgi:type VII secretion protein EccB